MVAAEKTILRQAVELEVAICSECQGTGTVLQWNEVAYFEDRRACARCEAGRKVDTKIADIAKRAQFEERISSR